MNPGTHQWTRVRKAGPRVGSTLVQPSRGPYAGLPVRRQRETEKEREREEDREEEERYITFEIRHLFPFLPVALRVDPGLGVADLPGRREPRSRPGHQVPTYHALLADERDGLRRALHPEHRMPRVLPGATAVRTSIPSGIPKIPARSH